MSWSEVKKINSDLSVPLDGRIQKYGGFLTRGEELKTVSIDTRPAQNGTTPAQTDLEIVNVEGSGYVTGILVKAYVSVYTQSSNKGSAAQNITINMFVDDQEYMFSASNSIEKVQNKNKTDAIDICLEMDKPISDGSIHNMSSSDQNQTTTFVTNLPLRFENCLRVTVTHSGGFRYYGGSSSDVKKDQQGIACIKYILC